MIDKAMTQCAALRYAAIDAGLRCDAGSLRIHMPVLWIRIFLRPLHPGDVLLAFRTINTGGLASVLADKLDLIMECRCCAFKFCVRSFYGYISPLFLRSAISNMIHVAAFIKRLILDGGDTERNIDTEQAAALAERLTSNTFDIAAQGHTGQAGALVECTTADTGNAIRDDNTRQAGALGERSTANAGDAVRDGDAGQAAAIIERRRTNAGDTVRDGDAGQAAAIGERKITNGGDTARDGDAG